MIVNLEVTDVQVNPELNLVNLVITPTFSSGEGFAPIQSISKNGVNIPPISGNVNIEVPTKTSELEDDSEFLTPDDLLAYQTKNDVGLETVSDNIVGAINEVNSIAKEKQNGLSFLDYGDLVTQIKGDSNLIVGQSIYLEKIDIPDLWVSKNDSVFNDYIYTNDDDFLVDIQSGVVIGIYNLSLLETGKVDLTNYYTKSQTDTLIALTAKLSGGNTFSDAQNFDGRINHKVGEKWFSAASKTQDTINDTQWYNLNGVEIHKVCTLGSTTKGGGTWVETYRLIAAEKVIVMAGKTRWNTDSRVNFLGDRAAVNAIVGENSCSVISANGMVRLLPNQGFGLDVLPNGHINTYGGKYHYMSTDTTDTINDTRSKSENGVQIKEKCTLGSVTKGNGTWIKTSIEGAEKSLTNNTAINILDINCAINTMQCGTITYAISAIDTVNNSVRSHSGVLSYNVRNQNGVITTNLVHNATMENDMGLISDTWALTNGTNKATLTLNANASGMTPTSMTLHFDISNLGKNDITLL